MQMDLSKESIKHWKTIRQMNKFKCIGAILLAFLSFNVFAQSEHIILWDVTRSMKGFDGVKFVPEKDIWDETKEKIIQQIENIQADGKTSIYIYPFQNPSDNPAGLDWKVSKNFNTIQKTQLIEWVKGFDINFKAQKSTNVCEALNKAYDKIDSFSNYEQIILALYTDGKQSDKSKLAPCDYDKATCLRDQVNRFCDLCDTLDKNRLYILKLKSYTSGITAKCSCVIEKDVVESFYRSIPHTSPKDFLEDNVVGKQLIVFDDVFGKMPDDLRVTAVSSNPNIVIHENVNVDDNGDLIIDFQKVTIGENEIEVAEISFTGTSAAANNEITIEPFVVKIENVKKSSLKIEGITIRP
jgi:hypothetical protein